jgi:glycosyltransferase involved in cell wall biosynthesis
VATMTRIVVLSRYGRLGASSRVRLFQYYPYLMARGIEVETYPFMPDDYLRLLYSKGSRSWKLSLSAYLRRFTVLLRRRDYDLLWIEKEIFPWLPSWAEWFLARLHVPYIADYDDAIFHNYDLNPRRLVRVCLGGKIDSVMRHASLVTVGNDYLAHRAKQAGAKRVEVIPTTVDLERYSLHPRNEVDSFTIGWIGTPVTAKYLLTVRSALEEVCKHHKTRLALIGSGDVDLAGVRCEIRPWSEESEADEIQAFDVGIMPLPDTPWEQGKCAYKIVQYMACSLPVVASPVGMNREIVTDGENGYLAATRVEWVESLEALRKDSGLRRRMGLSGRIKAEKEYSLQVTAPKIHSIIQQIARAN